MDYKKISSGLRPLGALWAAVAIALQMSAGAFALDGLKPGVPIETAPPTVSAPKTQTATSGSSTAAKTTEKKIIAEAYTHSQLQGADRMNYEAILKGIINRDATITLPVAMPLSKFTLLTDALVAEEIDIQFVGTQMRYSGDPVQKVSFDYALTKEQSTARAKALIEKADKIIAALPKGATDFQKVVFFHDYIISNTTYTQEGPHHDIASAYGALINGKALCHGYAQAMALLCSRSGIENCYATGKMVEPHIWNKVKLDGLWYNIDATSDDPEMQTELAGNLVFYEECLVTDKVIYANRTPFQAYVNPPQANSNLQNYFVQTKQYAADEKTFRQVVANGIYRMLTTTDSTFEIQCATEALAKASYEKYTAGDEFTELVKLVRNQYDLEAKNLKVVLHVRGSTVYAMLV